MKTSKKICICEKYRLLIKKVLTFFVIIVLNISCDTCAPADTDPEEFDIYFTARALGSELPAIYGINMVGLRLKEIKSASLMYSPPSIDKRIASEATDNIRRFEILRIDGETLNVIWTEDTDKKVIDPIISADGSKTAFNGGNNELHIAGSDGNLANRVSTKLADSTMASFSPNGNYVSFFEGTSPGSPVSLVILDVSSLSNISEVFRKDYSEGKSSFGTKISPRWSADSRFVIFTLFKEKSLNEIIIADVTSGSEKLLEVRDLGCNNPVLSADNNTIAFVSDRGNIWTRTISEAEPKYYKLTEADSGQRAVNLSWNNNLLLYVRHPVNRQTMFEGRMEILDVSTKKVSVLSNNVFSGFWNKH